MKLVFLASRILKNVWIFRVAFNLALASFIRRQNLRHAIPMTFDAFLTLISSFVIKRSSSPV
jgi:hypothetical protein